MALFSRVKTWAKEKLYFQDLNAEFDNILSHLVANYVTGWSSSATQMKLQSTPGAVGTESLSLSASDELERLRFVIARLIGTTYWYTAPSLSLADANTLLTQTAGTASNRISSGRVGPTSNQAMALVPNGAAASVALKATATNLAYYIAGTSYSATADSTLASLTVTGGAYTATINDAALTAQVSSKVQGENGTVITVDAMNVNISNLTGKYAGFKVVHGGNTEYFIARVDSATQLSHASRGFFFDSTDLPIARTAVADNDVITLVTLTYLFVKTDGTLDAAYTQPKVDYTTPSGAVSGDYWFDLSALLWKKHNGASFVAANASLIGVCIQDTANTVGARTFEYYANHTATNTILLDLFSTTQIQGKDLGERVTVLGHTHAFTTSLPKWASTGQFASGVTLATSTVYYLYITDVGQQLIDTVPPYDRTMDLQGYYHPHNPWRALGTFSTDGASLFLTPTSYGQTLLPPKFVTAAMVADATLTGTQMAPVLALTGVSLGVGGHNAVLSHYAGGTPIEIVVGRIAANGTAFSGNDEGYTVVRDGAGTYTVTYSAAFSYAPAVAVSQQSGASSVSESLVTNTTTSFQVQFQTTGVGAADAIWSFVAVGRRP